MDGQIERRRTLQLDAGEVIGELVPPRRLVGDDAERISCDSNGFAQPLPSRLDATKKSSASVAHAARILAAPTVARAWLQSCRRRVGSVRTRTASFASSDAVPFRATRALMPSSR